MEKCLKIDNLCFKMCQKLEISCYGFYLFRGQSQIPPFRSAKHDEGATALSRLINSFRKFHTKIDNFKKMLRYQNLFKPFGLSNQNVVHFNITKNGRAKRS